MSIPVRSRWAALPVLVLLLAPLGCRRALDLRELGGAVSPDAELAATIVESNPPGGALTRPRYYIYLTRHELPDMTDFEDSVWSSHDVYPAYVFWTGPRSLQILISPVGRDRFDQIRSGSKFGVTVETRVVTNLSKEGVCSADPGEIIPTRMRKH